MAFYVVTRMVQGKVFVLCCREIQRSIKDSVKKLLEDVIKKMGLETFFDCTRDEIRCLLTGSVAIFAGMRTQSAANVKSLEGVDICWNEESQTYSQESIDILTPTIRKPGSEILWTYNPQYDSDPVHAMFKHPRNDTVIIEISWRDNPDFPSVLMAELEHCRETDLEKYAWIWEGKTLKHNAAQVFKGKWVIQDFPDPPKETTFYCGIDWGFANDPTAATCSFIIDGVLYVWKEAGGVGIEIDETGKILDAVLPSKRWPCRADSARPETISFLNRQGYNLIPAKKGAGSVEDGISFLKSYKKIVVHPSCVKMIDELRNYCYKTDPKTGDVLPIIIDAWNHELDSLRYSLEALWKKDFFMV